LTGAPTSPSTPSAHTAPRKGGRQATTVERTLRAATAETEPVEYEHVPSQSPRRLLPERRHAGELKVERRGRLGRLGERLLESIDDVAHPPRLIGIGGQPDNDE
jgi:hypothetical protein